LKQRKLLDGTLITELDNSTVLKIKTKCPTKWKLIDLETGEEYLGNMPNEHHMFWKKIKDA
jgi:hypothetical protein